MYVEKAKIQNFSRTEMRKGWRPVGTEDQMWTRSLWRTAPPFTHVCRCAISSDITCEPLRTAFAVCYDLLLGYSAFLSAVRKQY